MNIKITSTAFQPGEAIPKECTGDGQDLSPPLSWGDSPTGTRSFALICEDPDAPRGTFTHWLVFNLPPETRELSKGLAPQPAGANGMVEQTLRMTNVDRLIELYPTVPDAAAAFSAAN